MFRRLIVGAVLLALTGAPRSAPGQAIVIGRNFEGTTAAIQPIPADTMGAAGIDHFVELNNDEFNVYRKSDGAQVQSKGINQFWLDANTSPVMTAFDPRIVYDPHARRWYAVSVDNKENANTILFAVSSSSDPTQPWNGFEFDSDSDDSNWADFPMLGYNLEAVWISAFMPTLGVGPSGSSFIGLPKLDLLQPVPSTANVVRFEDVPQSTAGTHPQLAVDTSPFGGNIPVLAMSSFGGGSLIKADVGLSSSQINAASPIFVPAAQPPTVVQPGAPAVQNLESNDWRFSSNTVLHSSGHLYAVQAIDDGGRAAVRYLRLDGTNNVIENLVLNDPTLAFTFPSIAVNDAGDIVIGVTGTSTTEFASSYALVRPAGSGVFDTRLLRAGVDNYVKLDSSGRNRWGDYSATTIDPADPSIFWTNQEFVAGTNRWATQVTELILPQPDEARWSEPIDGLFDDPTLWLTSHGGAPQPLDQVVFSRATDPGGSITISFPPNPAGYMNALATVRQGNVRLDLSGNHWDFLLHLEVGPYQGRPEATVANGTINSVAGFIAGRPTSEGYLTLDNAGWNVTDVIVGSPSTGTPGYPGEFGGTGVLTIDNNSQMTVGNTLKLWQRGTVNLADGVLTAATIESGGARSFSFTGGTLHVDKFVGELENTGGTLAPGASIGTTNVVLGYFQRAGGALDIEIGGTAPADYDRLIAALADLDGILDVSLVGGFMPSVGDVFDILDASILGSFATITLDPLPFGRRWDLSKLYVTGELSVLPPFEADFDEDGDVDGNDLANWKAGFGAATGAAHMDGDADGDRDVDGADFLTWQRQVGSVRPAVPAAGAVPEPATLMPLAVAIMVLAGRRRRMN